MDPSTKIEVSYTNKEISMQKRSVKARGAGKAGVWSDDAVSQAKAQGC